jgi:hypothetical protein
MRRLALVSLLKFIIVQYKAPVPPHLHAAHAQQPALPLVINPPQPISAVDQSMYIEEPTAIDGLLVPQLKAQLELHRPHIKVPEKSEIKKMRKSALVDLLKRVVAEYKTLQAADSGRNVQLIAQAGGSIIANDAPARMSKIRSTKTKKTVLKVQLELYRKLVPGIPTPVQLEGKKRDEFVDLLVNAVNHYKSSQTEGHAQGR